MDNILYKNPIFRLKNYGRITRTSRMYFRDILDGGIGKIDLESKLQALKAMWIPRLLTTNHIVKEYLDSFCERQKINIEFLIKTTKTKAENYGILEKFQISISKPLYVITYVKEIIN